MALVVAVLSFRLVESRQQNWVKRRPEVAAERKKAFIFMELLILIGLVVLFAGLAVSSSKSGNQAPPFKGPSLKSNATEQQPFKEVRSPAKPKDRFDRATAHEVSEKRRMLDGPAYVTDGDTITIQKTKIRLFGIDAPEIDHPYGKKAKWALVRLCKGHKITAEITDEDDYGRCVAKCYLPDGRDISAELVKQGLALDWPKFSDGRYAHLEVPGVRTKLWLADARQKGRMRVWKSFEEKQRSKENSRSCAVCGKDVPVQDKVNPRKFVCSCGATFSDCPKCLDGWLVERKGKRGSFLGCVRYPDCTGRKYLPKKRGEFART